jgi:hypothetical protein
VELTVHLYLVLRLKMHRYFDGLGDTSEMNVATQRSGTDLTSPTKRLLRIHGAPYVTAATQRLQSERILQRQQIHKHTVT